jgi:hypothetical protein
MIKVKIAFGPPTRRSRTAQYMYLLQIGNYTMADPSIDSVRQAVPFLKSVNESYYTLFNYANPAQAYPVYDTIVNPNNLKTGHTNNQNWLDPQITAVYVTDPNKNGGFTNVTVVVFDKNTKDVRIHLYGRTKSVAMPACFEKEKLSATLKHFKIQEEKKNGYCLYNAIERAANRLKAKAKPQNLAEPQFVLLIFKDNHYESYTPPDTWKPEGVVSKDCVNVTDPAVFLYSEFMQPSEYGCEKNMTLHYFKDGQITTDKSGKLNGLVAILKKTSKTKIRSIYSARKDKVQDLCSIDYLNEKVDLEKLSVTDKEALFQVHLQKYGEGKKLLKQKKFKKEQVDDLKCTFEDGVVKAYGLYTVTAINGTPLITVDNIGGLKELIGENKEFSLAFKKKPTPAFNVEKSVFHESANLPLFYEWLPLFPAPTTQTQTVEDVLTSCSNEKYRQYQPTIYDDISKRIVTLVKLDADTVAKTLELEEDNHEALKQYQTTHFIEAEKSLTCADSSIVYKMNYNMHSGVHLACQQPECKYSANNFGLFAVYLTKKTLENLGQQNFDDGSKMYVTWDYETEGASNGPVGGGAAPKPPTPPSPSDYAPADSGSDTGDEEFPESKKLSVAKLAEIMLHHGGMYEGKIPGPPPEDAYVKELEKYRMDFPPPKKQRTIIQPESDSESDTPGTDAAFFDRCVLGN